MRSIVLLKIIYVQLGYFSHFTTDFTFWIHHPSKLKFLQSKANISLLQSMFKYSS